MRKRICMFAAMAIICLIGITGCGSSTESDSPVEATTEQYFADQDFMDSLAKGLEARWAIKDELEESQYYTSEHRKHYMNLVNAELDQVEGYTTETFKDTGLQELAIKYINALKAQKAALDYVTVDPDRYDKEWEAAYNDRSKMITEFVNKYNLTVSDEYAETLNDFKVNSEVVENKEKNEAAVNKMVESLKFKKKKEEGDWITYSATINNTTDMDLKTLELNINLLDDEGVIIESMYDNVNNIKKGQKARVEFSTDLEFDKTSVEINYWE